MPLQPPLEGPAIADNVPYQTSQVADNCLIMLATDVLPAADLMDDQTVLMLSADYSYHLLVGPQPVPSDKVLLQQLTNSLTTRNVFVTLDPAAISDGEAVLPAFESGDVTVKKTNKKTCKTTRTVC